MGRQRCIWELLIWKPTEAGGGHCVEPLGDTEAGDMQTEARDYNMGRRGT